jgi:hypothetical protein
MTRLLVFGIITIFELTFLSGAASAQPPAPTADPAPLTPTATPAATARDPHRYLATARQQLQAVPTQALSKDATKKLDKLRQDFERLVAAYQRRAAATSASPSAEAVNWKLQFDAVERDLVAILGAGPSLGADTTPAAAGTSGVVPAPDVPRPSSQPAGTSSPTPVGAPSTPTPAAPGVASTGQTAAGSPAAQPGGSTEAQAGVTGAASANVQAAGLAGVAVAQIGVKNLNPAVREQLEEVRKSVELFYDATTSVPQMLEQGEVPKR